MPTGGAEVIPCLAREPPKSDASRSPSSSAASSPPGRRPNKPPSNRTRTESLMIHFYFHPTPNPAKIALFLTEAGLAPRAIPVDTNKGEKQSPSSPTITQNAHAPAPTPPHSTPRAGQRAVPP